MSCLHVALCVYLYLLVCVYLYRGFILTGPHLKLVKSPNLITFNSICNRMFQMLEISFDLNLNFFRGTSQKKHPVCICVCAVYVCLFFVTVTVSVYLYVNVFVYLYGSDLGLFVS